MAMSKEKLGDVNPDTLAQMSNQAMAYNGQGKRNMAEELMVDVVQNFRINLAENHVCTLISLYNLALIHMGQNAWHVAQGIWVSFVEKMRTVIGEKRKCTIRCTTFRFRNNSLASLRIFAPLTLICSLILPWLLLV
jgi:hypothetical protein